jgi:glutamate synthase (NADPH) small chain
VGKITGFKEYQRELPTRRPVSERINDWFEIYQDFPAEKVQLQGARCMDCGVPFCHTGCPLNNIIPDWNDFAYKARWRDAIRTLHATNNFPEFTGRICPAPCEAACVLGINEPPVAIKVIERSIIDHAWNEGWIRPEKAVTPTGKKVAVIPLEWPRHSNWRARATRSRSTRSRTESEVFSATESRTSRWRSITSTAASNRWKRKA